MNTNAKIICAVISGLAAGAAIGLLLAPAEGSELREQIMNKFDGLTEVFTKDNTATLEDDPDDLEHA